MYIYIYNKNIKERDFRTIGDKVATKFTALQCYNVRAKREQFFQE